MKSLAIAAVVAVSAIAVAEAAPMDGQDSSAFTTPVAVFSFLANTVYQACCV
ncbi:hypothetical protein PINS_up009905 [Pythium insidiosum]|nr:hypothetical protein PINS_up009904 [Pythium insidiosum]GLE01092.1 hypothetical protein PINS_up009905 [Pythium insidiosum]